MGRPVFACVYGLTLLVEQVRRNKILILDGHSTAAAASVLAFPRATEVHVAAKGTDCLGFASRRVTRRFNQPGALDKLLDWLRELDSEEAYDLVIPATEASLLAVKSDTLAPALRAKCVIASESSLDVALDKHHTLELASRLGIKIPAWDLIVAEDGAREPKNWPMVVKPVRSKVVMPTGTLSLTPRICVSPIEWQEALSDLLGWTPVLAQEYFPGHGIGVEVLFEHGVSRWVFAHRRIHEVPVTGGASSYRCSIPVPSDLGVATLSLLEELHWHGVAMVEFKVAKNGDYRLMEINPRLWGSLPLAIASGINFPLGLLHLATGKSPGRQPRYRLHYHARDVIKDAHWFEDSLRERHNPLRVSPLRIVDFIGLLRPLLGRESWDLFHLREPRMWWHTVRPALRGISARLKRIAVGFKARANWRRIAPRWCNGTVKRIVVLCGRNFAVSPVVASLLQGSLARVETVLACLHPAEQHTSPEEWTSMIQRIPGLDTRWHHPSALDATDPAQADLVLVMDLRDWRALSVSCPRAMRKAVLLGIAGATKQSAPIEIQDPVDADHAALRAIAIQLQQCTEQLILRWNSTSELHGRASGANAPGNILE